VAKKPPVNLLQIAAYGSHHQAVCLLFANHRGAPPAQIVPNLHISPLHLWRIAVAGIAAIATTSASATTCGIRWMIQFGSISYARLRANGEPVPGKCRAFETDSDPFRPLRLIRAAHHRGYKCPPWDSDAG
jgi:hypothetical protein